jgi:putative FmdB family regulatory protein
MPLYVYRCEGCGAETEGFRSVASRDAVASCARMGCAPAGHQLRRRLTVPQRTIMRPSGYSLRPGDKGYWAFETPNGRAAPHERRAVAPFAEAEALYKSPPTPHDDTVPVQL